MTIDVDALMAEIDAEVRARRASGDLPPQFERELDLVFARYAPVGFGGSDLESVLARAEQASFIDVAAPVESPRPGVPLVKKVIRKGMGWYLHYVAEQVTTLGAVLTRALRLLAQRVDALEQAAGADAGSPGLAGALVPSPDLAHWEPLLVRILGGAGGRVLHGECGAGALVAALRGAGIDAYGTDPVPERAEQADAAGVEARRVELLEHLRALGDGALGGLVLSGAVDRLPPAAQRELAELAASRLAPGRWVAVLGTFPSAWARTVGPVAADLAPGRPLHPQTWAWLLDAAGFSKIEVHPGPAAEGLSPVPGEYAAARVLNANLERLSAVLFGPEAYAVVGVAPEPGRP